jgi:hypothetical protein
MEKQTLSTVQGAFTFFGTIADVDMLQQALTRIPLYASHQTVLETCNEVGIASLPNNSFTSKLSLSQFYQIATTIDRKLLGAISSLASVEEARELLEQLGLSAVTDDEESSPPGDEAAPFFLTPPPGPLVISVPSSPIERHRSVSSVPKALTATPAVPLPPMGVSAAWLSPNPSQKGRGQRSSIFLHDVPPTSSALDDHFSRVADRIRSQHQCKSVPQDRPKQRTMGEMLHLPQLSAEELACCENTRTQFPALELSRNESSWISDSGFVAMNSPIPTRKPTAEQQISAAIHNDQLRSNWCNAMIEQTYRRAGDVGISTASCAKLIQRGAVEKAKRKELERLEKKKRKLREKFVL